MLLRLDTREILLFPPPLSWQTVPYWTMVALLGREDMI